MPPPLPVAVALRRVVDTLGSWVRRRKGTMKVLPFLTNPAFPSDAE